jgi:DNA repair and recombination RAD54-like protein
MIVSYETLRTLTQYLAGATIGLLLCDEGHRLKNSESLTYQALDSLNVKRRVILSGTPIQVALPPRHWPTTKHSQNDLSEYFSLLSFANPSFLGSKADFRKNFENAIIKGRDADASDAVKASCEEKLKQLSGLVTKFIIRRTNDLLSKYREYFLTTMLAISYYKSKCPSNTNTLYSVGCPIFSCHCIGCSLRRRKSRLCYGEQNLNR